MTATPQLPLIEAPPAERKPTVDYWLLAIQLAHPGTLPEGWRLYSYKCLEDADNSALLKGCVEPPPKTTGKNKGRPNWSKVDKTTERTFIVSMRQKDAAVLHFESTTGDCHHCYGNGTEIASMGIHGTTYRTCHRCKGSGKAAARAVEVSHGS